MKVDDSKRFSKSPKLFSFEVLADKLDTKTGWKVSNDVLRGRLLMLAVSELLDCSMSSNALLDLELRKR